MATTTENVSNRTREEVEELRRDLRGLRREMARYAASGREKLSELGTSGRARLEQASEAAGHRVAERPFVSLIAALGAGLILGALLTHRLERD